MAQEAKSSDPSSIPDHDTSFDVPLPVSSLALDFDWNPVTGRTDNDTATITEAI